MEVNIKILPGNPAFFFGNDMRVGMILVESIELRQNANGELQAFYKAGGENPFYVPDEVCHASVEEVLETLLPVSLIGTKKVVLVDAVQEPAPKGRGRGISSKPAVEAAPAAATAQQTPMYGPQEPADNDDNLFKQ